jgi:hypothetical protein
MPYQIAGIDVHKKMVAVVAADVEGEGPGTEESAGKNYSPAVPKATARCGAS